MCLPDVSRCIESMPVPGSRAREYATMLGGAVAAGVCGALFDQVTCSISPEHFLDGKGLAGSHLPFRLAVAWIGFRGGLPLGALVVGVGLFLAGRRESFAWWPFLMQIGLTVALFLPVCAAALVLVDPWDIHAASRGVWMDSVATRYLTTWGLHIGVYVGILAGLLRAARAPAARALPPLST